MADLDYGQLRKDAEWCRELGHITLRAYLSSFRTMYPGIELTWRQAKIPITRPRMTQLGVEQWKYDLAIRDEEFREKQSIVMCCGGYDYMKVGFAKTKTKFDIFDRVIDPFLLFPTFPNRNMERRFVERLESQVDNFRNDPRNAYHREDIRGMWILPDTDEPVKPDIEKRL